VNQAFLGQHPHDLSALVRAQSDLFAQLASTDGSLSDLITNFNTTTGALAAESANLSASIRELAPTLEEARPSLAHLNAALPPFRALARASVPGIQELPATIRAGSPWLVQTAKLLGPRELGGAAKELEAAAPGSPT
jgi:ABC-type transporter Mla subunit MlaD